MDITAVILSTAVVFGLNPFDNSVYQEEVYKPIAMPVHQIKWAGENKLNRLSISKEIKKSDLADFKLLNNDNFGYKYKNNDKNELFEDLENGRKKITIRFPIEKYEPISIEELKAFFDMKSQNIKSLSVIGFASPDGAKPLMQETLAKQRADKIVKILLSMGIKVEDVSSIVCHKGVEPSTCWRADVYVEIEEEKSK